MKVFKKFLAALLAAVMVFALVAFTACDKNKDKDKDKDSTDKTDPSDPGNTPGNTPGTTATPAESLLSAIEKAASSFTLSLEYVNEHALESYRVAAIDGEKPATGVDTSSYTATIGANVKADLENGNADVVVTSTEQEGENTSKAISYYFARGWNLFTYAVETEEGEDPEEVSDFTGKTLFSMGNPNDMLMGILQGSLGGSDDAPVPMAEEEEPALPEVTDYATLVLPQVNAFLVKLADATGTLKVESGVYTVDVIKALNKIKTDLLTYAVSCKADTTVESVLTNPTVKKYLTLFTDYIPAETLYGAICGAASSFAEDPEFGEMVAMLGIDETFLAAVAPETGVSSYDYILALLKNESVKNVANAAMYMLASMQSPALASANPAEETPSIPETFTKTLEQTTLGEILALAGIESFDFSTLNDLFDSLPVQISDSGVTISTTYIENSKSESGDSFTSDKTTETQKFTKLEVGFTVTDGKVTAQSLVMEAENAYNSRYTYDPENGYSAHESSDEMTYDISIAYGEVTGLADINSCTVISEQEVWKESSSSVYFNPADFGYVGEEITLTVTLKVVGGEPAGVEIKDGSTPVTMNGHNFTITRNLIREEFESDPEAQPETANFNFIYDLHLNGSYDVKFMMYDSSVPNVDPTCSTTFSTQTEYYSSTVAKVVAGTPDWTVVTE